MTKLFQYTNYIDYNELINKPIINKVVVEGNKSLTDYGIQPAGSYAHLNKNGKVPLEELDDSLLGNLQFQAVWDAENNNPQLPLVPTKKGQYWIVSHSGNRFGLSFNTGDWLVAGDGVWQKVDNSDAVSSVNNKIGNVVLTSEDINHNNQTVASAIDSKQNKLVPGENIVINGDTISAKLVASTDYNLAYHKPSINGVELINAKQLEDFDIQKTIKAGENVYLTKSNINKMADTINVYDASETQKGVSQAATQEEIDLGEDNFKYITPQKLKSITDNTQDELDKKADKETSYTKNEIDVEINAINTIIETKADKSALPTTSSLMNGEAPVVSDIDTSLVTNIEELAESINNLLAYLRSRNVIA